MKGETMFKVDIERLPSFQIGEQRGEQRGKEIGEQRGKEIGEQRGKEIGEQNAMSKVVKNLLSKNNDIAFIVDVTGLTIQEIEKLKEYQEN